MASLRKDASLRKGWHPMKKDGIPFWLDVEAGALFEPFVGFDRAVAVEVGA
jgi:hypothetical protein